MAGVGACVETWIRGGDNFTVDVMDGVDIKESHTSSCADPEEEGVGGGYRTCCASWDVRKMTHISAVTCARKENNSL